MPGRTHECESLRAARRILSDFIDVRERIKVTAEGFAVLDFVQGNVAAELPAATARDLVAVIRSERAPLPAAELHDLVLLWLENYRRASSQMIMRVLEDGSGPLSA